MAQRKLQAEIDRTLKRVKEGCDEFDSILSKVHDAPTTNQKEKFEAELKKEIKKLQRLRDQIKSWASSNEVKQKAPLLEARRIVETKMEAFKETERASKMKAYSTEGLNMADDDDDEKSAARNQIHEWMDSLKQQVDGFEAEIEQVPIKKRAADARCLELDYSLERHRFHVEMLERILRNIENEYLEPDAIEQIKGDLEYYIEQNQEQDFYEDEDMYECLDLPDDIAGAERTAAGDEDEDGELESDGEDSKKPAEDAEPARVVVPEGSKIAPGSLIQPGAGPAAPVAQPLLQPKVDKPKPKKETPLPKPAAPKSGMTMAQLLGGGAKAPQPAVIPVATQPAQPTPVQPAVVVVPQPKEAPKKDGPPGVAGPAVVAAAPSVDTTPKQPTRTLAEMLRSSADRDKPQPKVAPKSDLRPMSKDSEGSLDQRVPDSMDQRVTNSLSDMTASSNENNVPPSSDYSVGDDMDGSHVTRMAGGPHDMNSDPSQGVSMQRHPGVPMMEGPPAQPGMQRVVANPSMRYLESSLQNLPEPQRGSILGGGYIPPHPVQTPPHYPQVPSPGFDKSSVYRGMEPDTLFFMFYFQQRTYRQLLAARELKRQSWRFHKQHLAWFQRHDEPSEQTAEYERGNFIFFDFEQGWCRRVKQDFTFEYKHLENEV